MTDQVVQLFLVDLAIIVLLARLFQSSWLNGFRAIRLSTISEVLPTDATAFILRAMRARNQPIPPPVPFQATTMEQLLGCVCDHYRVVIIDDDPANENPSGVAGTITGVIDGVVHLREISVDGYWVEGGRVVACRGARCRLGHGRKCSPRHRRQRDFERLDVELARSDFASSL